jgi:hypothetical protein
MPHTVTIEKTIFAFDELDSRAKEKARAWWRSCESSEFDTECTYEDAAECGRLIGIEIAPCNVKLKRRRRRSAPDITKITKT